MDCFVTSVPRNDVLGYTARVLAHALDNRRSHALCAMTCYNTYKPRTTISAINGIANIERKRRQ